MNSIDLKELGIAMMIFGFGGAIIMGILMYIVMWMEQGEFLWWL